MWIMIVMLMLSFAWLLYETDFMRIRLESYEYQKKQALESKSRGVKDEKNSNIPIDTEENIEPYKPTLFIPLDMPELRGTLNIICKRG